MKCKKKDEKYHRIVQDSAAILCRIFSPVNEVNRAVRRTAGGREGKSD